ncbi:cytochrome c1 [Pseudomonas asuensis]|uniref:Cytochrome c1 n=1 Tax=Pseudomonas asuensis TaxID=1825787 RepID=A0ABQ2GGP5_9PSED|nr:cytochrome c1 [Pseudomonas asuensis]
MLLLRLLALLSVLGVPLASMGAEDIPPEKVRVTTTDKHALQDGARTFVNYCMGCHGAQYQRYERVARDLEIPEDILQQALIFTSAKPGDHMRSSMRAEDARSWFGAVPPDLTLVARVRGEDWLYGYLMGFYEDASRPWGVNNIVFPNVAMPNVLGALQGRQVCLTDNPGADASVNIAICRELAVVPGTGAQNNEQFDQTVRNLVAFLAYSADPNKEVSERIGRYVLAYLAILFVFAYLLKREYWKDIK